MSSPNLVTRRPDGIPIVTTGIRRMGGAMTIGAGGGRKTRGGGSAMRRLMLLVMAGLACLALAAGPARASGWSDTLTESPEGRNVLDTVEKAYEAWRSSGNATRGGSGALGELLYSSDQLICGAWIIQFRSWYFGFLLQEVRYPSPEGAALEQAARQLLEAVIAACLPILDPDTYRIVNESGFVPAPPAPEPEPAGVDVRMVDGVWILVADDEVCRRQCDAQRQAFLDARAELARIESAVAAAEKEAAAIETTTIPVHQAQVAAAEREVADARQWLSGLPASSIQAREAAASRLSRAETEVGNRRRELAEARAALEAARTAVARLRAQLPAALNAMQAALDAYRDCLRRCVKQAEGRVDDKGRFARDTILVLDQWERIIAERRRSYGIPAPRTARAPGPAAPAAGAAAGALLATAGGADGAAALACGTAGAGACVLFGGSVGAVNIGVGDGIGLGTLPGLPGEPLLVSHGSRLWGHSLGLDLAFHLPDFRVGVGASYLDATGSATAFEPISGAPVAYTFGEDAFGSTGLFLGATGAEVRSEVAYSQYEARVDLMMSDIAALRHMYGADTGPGSAAPSPWSLGLVGLFSHSSLEHAGTFRSLTYADVGAEVNRTLTTDAFGIGPKVELTHVVGDGWSVALGADLQLVWRHSTLRSREAITCVPCGVLPDHFDIDVTDGRSGFDWAGGLDVGLSYQLSPGLTLTLGGAVDIGGRDTIQVRANPSEPATGIRRETAVDWSLSFGAKLRF